jgi:hypothetical protein
MADGAAAPPTAPRASRRPRRTRTGSLLEPFPPDWRLKARPLRLRTSRTRRTRQGWPVRRETQSTRTGSRGSRRCDREPRPRDVRARWTRLGSEDAPTHGIARSGGGQPGQHGDQHEYQGSSRLSGLHVQERLDREGREGRKPAQEPHPESRCNCPAPSIHAPRAEALGAKGGLSPPVRTP